MDADPANHTIRALDYAHTLFPLRHMPGSFLYLWRHSYGADGMYTYPPLYHVILGVFCRFTPQPSWAVIATNMAFLVLLLYSVIRIGRRAFDLTIGVTAAALVATYSYCAFLQHEAFIEFALTAACAYAAWRLLQTQGFSRRGPSLAAGLCIGLAILIKHMAAVYLAGPVLCILWCERKSLNDKKFVNVLWSMAVALAVALSWYALHIHDLLANLKANQDYPVDAGIPMPWTIAGMLYYPSKLCSEQTGCVGFVLLLAAAFLWITRGLSSGAVTPQRRTARGIIVAYFLVGLLLLTFAFKNKDPRFSTPILPGVALFTCGGIGLIRARAVRYWAMGILALGALPFYTASMFDWPPAPRDIGFKSAGLDWGIWTSDVDNGPRQEKWPIVPILQRAMLKWRGHAPAPRPLLGLLPYFGHFSPRSFALEAELHDNIPIDIEQAGEKPGVEQLERFDFLLAKPGDQEAQGVDFLTHYAVEFRTYIVAHPAEFRLVGTFLLPDKSIVELYQAAHVTRIQKNSSP